MIKRLSSRQFIAIFLPTFMVCVWSGYVFIDAGVPSGLLHWKFYASLSGFLIFLMLTMTFIINWAQSKRSLLNIFKRHIN